MGFARGRIALGVGFLAVILTLSSCSVRSAATGVVIDVEGAFNEVTRFTVRTTDGEDLTFVPSVDGDFAFPLGHLREHLLAGTPILVEWVDEDGELKATFIDDDAAASPHRLSG